MLRRTREEEEPEGERGSVAAAGGSGGRFGQTLGLKGTNEGVGVVPQGGYWRGCCNIQQLQWWGTKLGYTFGLPNGGSTSSMRGWGFRVRCVRQGD
eukprot:767108-Hanusia_phi.AAC.8